MKYFHQITLFILNIFLVADSLEFIRCIARVKYDGTNFAGWQFVGPNIRSVQSILNSCLSQRFQHEVKSTGASRTDSGVHARGQALHWDVPLSKWNENCDFDLLQHSLNKMLPDDVRIFDMRVAPPPTICDKGKMDRWHAIRSAIGKHYSYTFSTHPVPDPCRRLQVTPITGSFDVQLMRQALSLFKGTHDFSAFTNRLTSYQKNVAAQNRRPLSTIKRITNISMSDVAGEELEYRVDVHLHSALYKMVRNVVGAAFSVAQGRMQLDYLKALIRAPPLTDGKTTREFNPTVTAPPQGLCLERVYYDDY